MQKHVIAVLTLFAVTLWLFGSILHDSPLDTHEDLDTYERTLEYIREIKNGFPQPQLFMSGMGGRGYAFPVFYPQLPYYLSAFTTWLFGGVVLGVHVAFFLACYLSAISAYICATGIRLRPAFALIAGAAYLAGPYRLQLVFTRGAYAETCCLVWLPLILLGAWQLVNRRGYLVLAFSTAALLVTHMVMAIWTAALLLIVLIVTVTVARNLWSIRQVLTGIAACVLGVGLAAWFIVPQQYYLPGVKASNQEFVWATIEHSQGNRLNWQQLLLGDHTGIVPWLALVCSVIVLVRKFRGAEMDTGMAALMAGLSVSLVVGLWAIEAPELFLNILPRQFAYIQFPWRLLGWVQFAGAIIVAICLQPARPLRLELLAALCGCGLLLFLVPSASKVFQYDSTGYPSLEIVSQEVPSGFDVLGEYLPTTWTRPTGPESPTLPVIDSGRVLAFNKTTVSATVVAENDPEKTGIMTLPLVAYPFWKAYSERGNPISINDNQGLIQIKVLEGRSSVMLRRSYTWPWKLGWGITSLSLLLIVLMKASMAWTKRAGS